MKKVFFILVALVLALSVGLIGCDGGVVGPPTDKVYMFASRSLSGPLEAIGDYAFGPVMDYWQDGVNSAGGIPVGGTIGTKLVDLTIVDDTSDMGIMSGLLSSAIASNNYHFMLPPCSTSFLQSAAGICSGSGYVLIGAEGGCTSIQDVLDTPAYDHLFATLTFSTWGQMEALFDVLLEYQLNHGMPDPADVYIMYIGDLHGFEYRAAFLSYIIEDAVKGWPGTYKNNFTLVGGDNPVPIEAVTVDSFLSEADSLNATVLCSFTYPPASMLTVSESIDNTYNFPAMIVGPGINFEFMLLDVVSGITCNLDLEGVMGFTTWNEASGGNVTKDFAKDFGDFFGQPLGTAVNGTSRVIINLEVGGPPAMDRFIMDWWGAMPYMAGLEILQEAIERTNSVSNSDIRAELAKGASAKFSTTFGDAWFVRADGTTAPGTGSGGLLCKEFYHGHIGQWQYDAGNVIIPPQYFPGINATNCGADYWGWMIYEIIDDGTGTAPGIYPKPDWGAYP